ELWLVVPVYNEEQSLRSMINEWMPAVRAVAPDFVFCALNDGSRDSSLEVLREMKKEHPELRVVDKSNSGHGQTCVHGYRLAEAEGAQWILQIDSDGQCDPEFFSRFWEARKHHPVIYGFRAQRDDGLKRYFISRIVSVATYVGTGIWVRDANVPYRLMHVDAV